MTAPYSHHVQKQSAYRSPEQRARDGAASKAAAAAGGPTSVERAVSALNPLQNNYGNYGLYAGGGALAGAGIGALINALRGKSIGRGAIGGGLLGLGAGLGVKGLGDYGLSDEKKLIDDSEQIGADLTESEKLFRFRSLFPGLTQGQIDSRAAAQQLDLAKNRGLLDALFGSRVAYDPGTHAWRR